jgi:hypothetical protein
MVLAGSEAWDARSLALSLAAEPEEGLSALRSNAVEQWLRRGLGDAQLATRIEELVRHREHDDGSGEATMLMHSIAVLDPLAPLCWRGAALWPDGLGPALVAAEGTDSELTAHLEEIVRGEKVGSWAAFRSDRCDFAALRAEARQQHGWLRRHSGKRGGSTRLVYLMNPLTPCASRLLEGRWIANLAELLPALEEVAGRVDHRQVEPVDVHIAAFISARLERRLSDEFYAGAETGTASGAGRLAELRLLAQLQVRLHPRPLPALAAWLAARAGPALAGWRNRERRAHLEERLRVLAQGGYLAPMVQILEDPEAQGLDSREAQQAVEQLARIDAELTAISHGAEQRATTAARLGQEIAAGLGLIALAAALAVAALG